MRFPSFHRAAREPLLGCVVSVVTFVVYLTTICPTVSFIDAGELATVGTLLGIAHPTGYPLFSLITHLATWLPLGAEAIVKLNVFTALTVAAANGLFFTFLLALYRFEPVLRGRKGSDAEQPTTGVLIAAFVAALCFGFSATVWSQSVAIEVYGLHLFLILLTLTLFMQGVQEVSDLGIISRKLIAASFVLGLSFSNHLTTLLLLPALVFLYIHRYGLTRSSLRQALALAPFFVLGLTPYLYLPLRAASHPPLEWGAPVTLEKLIWHVSGKQYRSWMFTGFESAEKQFNYFVAHFSSEFHWLIVAVIALGVFGAARLRRTTFWFTLIAFAGCLLYSINYDIHDIDSYFLLAYVAAGIFAFVGLITIMDFAAHRWRTRGVMLAGVFLLVLPSGQVAQNWREASEHDNFMTEDYVHNVFDNTDQHAVIISYQWDYFVAPSEYFQVVRGERPDLVIIDKELLRRSWYFRQLNDRFPWLMDRCRGSVDAFLTELYKFEHDLPYNPQAIEGAYVRMINEMIDQSMRDRPVYLGPEIEPEFGSGLRRIPEGLLYRLSAADTLPAALPRINYRPASLDTRLTRGMRLMYARMLTETGSRLFSRGEREYAKNCLEKALSIDPTFEPARRWSKSAGF
jgi:hypothetical protein